ncbi:MAG: hypothetical protein ABI670_02140 [Chloroflexota bacterium]
MYTHGPDKYVVSMVWLSGGVDRRDSEPGAGRSFVPVRYEVRIRGRLDSRWSDWFEGVQINSTEDGDTMLRGELLDQSALHGLLEKIRDLNLTLISVNRLAEDQTSRDPR